MEHKWKAKFGYIKIKKKSWLSKGLHTDWNSLKTQAKIQNLTWNASNHKLVQPRKYKLVENNDPMEK